jgi:hypothetical protein
MGEATGRHEMGVRDQSRLFVLQGSALFRRGVCSLGWSFMLHVFHAFRYSSA